MMGRREFIALLGGAAAAWPLSARAQQDGRVRRIGVLFGGPLSSRENDRYWAAFRDALAKLGWVEGRNLHIDLRFGDADAGLTQTQAEELAKLVPDVIFSINGTATLAVQRQTKTIPIVFFGGGGGPPVANIARPEGNTTGFAGANNSIGGKWVELLKEIAPNVAKVAFIFNPSTSITPDGGGYFPSVEDAARAHAVKVIALPARNADETERRIVAFAAEPNGGLIVHPLPADRELIFRLAVEHRLPAAGQTKADVAAGSLFAYLYDRLETVPRVASYVDRILRGEKVSNLPVQFPTKFELIINLKTAKALGLEVSRDMLSIADEVIE